mgnify:CR=1 FL=1
MASRMFEAMAGQDSRQDPRQMMEAMRGDYRRFMAQQDRRADPRAMIERGLQEGRFTPQQVEMARQMAAKFGPMLMGR